jgi:hypothetical protein
MIFRLSMSVFSLRRRQTWGALLLSPLLVASRCDEPLSLGSDATSASSDQGKSGMAGNPMGGGGKGAAAAGAGGVTGGTAASSAGREAGGRETAGAAGQIAGRAPVTVGSEAGAGGTPPLPDCQPGSSTTGVFEITSTDDLGALRGIERLDGSLSVTGSVDDLSSLSCLQSVSGRLRVGRTGLHDLAGLEQLTIIGEGLTLDNNAALVSIAALGGLTAVAGDVLVIDDASLSSLEGLEWMTHAAAAVRIERNDALASLEALSNLAQVDGELAIASNPSLTSLTGLEQLREATRLDIDFNPISTLQPLQALTHVGGLRIANSNLLLDLAGLEGLTAIDSELAILANEKLADISAVSHAREIASIYVRENPSLSSLHGLEAVTETSDLNLFRNAKLFDLQGIANLTTVLGSVEISENASLQSLAPLAHLDSIGGYLTLVGNPVLATLTGLGGVRAVEWLTIENNSKLIDLTGLYSLEKVGITDVGSFVIKENGKLESLRGLDALTTINARVEIIANPSLRSLQGLGAATVISDFSVLDNPSLQSLDGLEHLARVGFVNVNSNVSLKSINALSALRRVDGSLFISGNPLLPRCQCDRLLARIGAANVHDSVSFEGNDESAACLP